MTREEAYNRIDAIIAKHEIDDEYVTITSILDYDALRMARKALEQASCEDAISREDALMCLTGEIKETDTIETIIARSGRRIRKLPPVTPQSKMGEWISVEDRLPEEGEEVLVWYRYWRYGEYNNWYYTYGIGYQYTGIFSVIDGGVRQSVYAWQELPEQYIVEPQESEE